MLSYDSLDTTIEGHRQRFGIIDVANCQVDLGDSDQKIVCCATLWAFFGVVIIMRGRSFQKLEGAPGPNCRPGNAV